MSKQWFRNWFNSPYYHLLYQQRNTDEAGKFISHLNQYLNLKPGARLLDVGCGRGRHAKLLQQQGHEVTGIDLSVANIEYAMHDAQKGLQFFAHDMRQLYYRDYFDGVVNLFTSFGYFSTGEEHIRVLKNMYNALRFGGWLVLDYLNSNAVAKGLKAEDTKIVDGVTFNLSKRIEGASVIKKIVLTDQQHTETFEEQVKLFTPHDFETMFKQSGFTVADTFGNYQLDPFDADISDRLIFICKKTHD